MVQNVTYTVVLAIFRFPKRGHFGRTNMVFLIRFGSDRKSLRCYVYRHFSDFEVSKNAFLFVFARRRFWTFFWILIGKCASNSHTYAKWDPPLKSSSRKRIEKWDPELARKAIWGVLLVPDQGGLNVLKTRIRQSNVIFGGVWWERLGHSDFKCWNEGVTFRRFRKALFSFLLPKAFILALGMAAGVVLSFPLQDSH